MKNKKLCPKCNSLLYEDAIEEVLFDKSGNMILDAFPAWVCTEQCGYYERSGLN
ncbi:hypothetical protein V7149_16245 [Bacillus sp. JJ1503]|uniref:hypothetical protein n=1 Tax=unclassified Bacillus (in: firmicutes) TaxID=185979 RepID=UPI002FFE5C33